MRRVIAWISIFGFLMLLVNIFFIRKFMIQSLFIYGGIIAYYLIFNLNRNHDKKIEDESIEKDSDIEKDPDIE
ncbi:MAG: hypothetical protein ABF289_09165 [Clostridiales bacterium]